MPAVLEVSVGALKRLPEWYVILSAVVCGAAFTLTAIAFYATWEIFG